MKFSSVLLQRSLFELSRDLSWAEHKRKGYVIRDPADADELLYLSESEYNKLIRVMMSNESSLDVIATPRDNPASILRKFPDPKSKGSTESPLMGSSEFTRDFMFDLIPGWIIKDSMIEFERNFDKFFPQYYKTIISWLGMKSSLVNTRAVWKLGKQFDLIKRTRGINDVILRLKISSICILKYLSKESLKTTQPLGQRIKLINGLPASLPSSLRRLIRSGSINYIRVLISLFASYKGFKGIYKAPDMSSITAPRFTRKFNRKSSPLSIIGLTPAFMADIRHTLNGMPQHEDWVEVYDTRDKFWKGFSKTPLTICPLVVNEPLINTSHLPLTVTASPNDSISFRGMGLDALAHFQNTERGLFNLLAVLTKTSDDQSMIIPDLKLDRVVDQNDPTGLKWVYTQMFKLKEEILKGKHWKDIPVLKLGKLSLKYEPAGKVRVFAISDYWTQLVMKLFHQAMFDKLKYHPSDATFDQLGKVEQFMHKPHDYIASYDLKSATDMIPQQLYVHVFAAQWGLELAQAWMDTMVNREYWFENKSYRYSRGQPMGTLSSWSSLAVIHHYLIFLSAHRVKVNNFNDYLVLGDDVVIGNKQVADSYVKVCSDYGVLIGLPKSFTSNARFFQFASQDILDKTNISPISLREVMSITQREKFSNFSSGLTALGGKTEFVNRMLRKGFIEGNNPISLVRSLVSYRDWRIISRSLSKGHLPPRLVNVLLMLLSSPIRVKLNMFSVSQLMAVLYRDINALTKPNFKYSLEQEHNFITDILVMLDSKVLSLARDIMAKVGNQSSCKLSETYLHPYYVIARDSSNLKTWAKVHELRKEWKQLSEKIIADIAHNNIHYYLSSEIRPVDLSFVDIDKYNSIISQLNSLRTNVEILEEISSNTSSGSTPKRVKTFLAFQSKYRSEEETMSWLAAL